MSKKEIEEIVVFAVNSELKEYKRTLNLDKEGKWKEAEFRADLGMDSLKTVETFMICEKEFGITFTDDEIFKADTIGKLIEKIEGKLPNLTR